MTKLVVNNLGLQDYKKTWQAMQDYTKNRDETSSDQLWVVEHPPVYTLGRNGKEEHIFAKSDIPIIKVDRGGQVTYHGPGQLIIYFLLDLHRLNLGVRELVTLIEDSIIALLNDYHVSAYSDKKAPGVYINKQKIAALGLRVSKGRTTHGLSLNINMDLTPFNNINPCGYKGLEVTQCQTQGIDDSLPIIANKLLHWLIIKLSSQTGFGRTSD